MYNKYGIIIIFYLQEAAVNKSNNAYDRFRESTLESVRECTIRGQLEFIPSDNPVDISEVEPASEIVKRFATGVRICNNRNNNKLFCFLISLT